MQNKDRRNRLAAGSVLFLLTLFGCVSVQKGPPKLFEIQAMTSDKTLREAVTSLERRGFTCSRSTGPFISDEKNRTDYIYCDGTWPMSFPVSRRFQVALFHKDGRVTETLIADGLTGP